jgi:hypothetical protein
MRLITQEFGYDPARLVMQPPPPQPPPIALSLNLAAPNLAENLLLPEVRSILQSHGIKLDPMPSQEAVAVAAMERAKNQEHGGIADKANLLDKHQTEKTGLQDGTPPLAGPPAHSVMPPGMVQ